MCSVGRLSQDDLLLPWLTVRESLQFSVRLRLPDTSEAHKSDAAAEALVEEALRLLRLESVAESMVGGDHARGVPSGGVSGGERRRVALGIELVSRPSVLLLDECTSGLDAANALLITRILQVYAMRGGATIVLTIHQPRQAIFESFDRLLLLAKGHLIYSDTPGRLSEKLRSVGLRGPPSGTNTADFLLDLAAGVAEDNDDEDITNSYADDDEEEDALPEAARRLATTCHYKPTQTSTTMPPSSPPRAPLSELNQLRVLLHRYALQRWRGRISLSLAYTAITLATITVGLISYVSSRLDTFPPKSLTPTHNEALLLSSTLHAVSFGLLAMNSILPNLDHYEREALCGISPSAWLSSRILLDLPHTFLGCLLCASALKDATPLSTPLSILTLAITSHTFACIGLALPLACTRQPPRYAHLLASLLLLMLGGLFNGVALLPLSSLERTGYAFMLWPSAARWSSELMMIYEVLSMPPSSLIRILVSEYLQRHRIAFSVLGGAISEWPVKLLQLLCRNVSALLVIGLVGRGVAYLRFVRSHTPILLTRVAEPSRARGWFRSLC